MPSRRPPFLVPGKRYAEASVEEIVAALNVYHESYNLFPQRFSRDLVYPVTVASFHAAREQVQYSGNAQIISSTHPTPAMSTPSPFATMPGMPQTVNFSEEQLARMARASEEVSNRQLKKLEDDDNRAKARELREQREEERQAVREAREAALHAKAMEVAAATTAAAGASGTNPQLMDESLVGKIPPQVAAVLRTIVGLPQKELIDLLAGKFDPLDLWKFFSHINNILTDTSNVFSISSDNQITTANDKSTLKRFGKTPTDIKAIYTGAFINLIMATGEFWQNNPRLPIVMLAFLKHVIKLFTIYQAPAVLRCAVFYHCLIASNGETRDLTAWVIPQSFLDEYLTPDQILPQRSHPIPASTTNKPSAKAAPRAMVCNAWNTSGCSKDHCQYAHTCWTCYSTTHGKEKCTKGK
jgi:hypothetical protein